MPDIRVFQVSDLTSVTLDWLLLPAGGLDDTEQLATAIIVAIGTDRRALPTDDLPNIGDDDRRGWWGDLNADTIWNGWPIGSRLWLLGRSKITGVAAKDGSTLNKVRAYLNEAIQPFIALGVASALTIDVVRRGRNEIDATVTLYRGPKTAIQLQFSDLWNGIASGAAQ